MALPGTNMLAGTMRELLGMGARILIGAVPGGPGWPASLMRAPSFQSFALLLGLAAWGFPLQRRRAADVLVFSATMSSSAAGDLDPRTDPGTTRSNRCAQALTHLGW